MKFLDQAKIYVKSGNGGPGCMSFHREKYVEYGGPDGGNGGKGGDVYIHAVSNLNTLIDFRYTQHFKAENGHNGQGRNKSGRGGEDITVNVPIGTQIIDEDKETVLLDMVNDGDTVLFMRGGDGGFGNAHYKSSTNQAPRKTTSGWPGEERDLWLRLKLIADVGLIGMPNAGKSTFLSACSRANPKIADYPFTTLHPNLGVVRRHGQEFILADIPGLIEGAHEGLGLGHRFLGHVERSAILLHMIDITQDDPAKAYKTIREELKSYGGEISTKREIVALNKSDALGDELSAYQAEEFEAATGIKPYVMSAVAGLGLDPVLNELGDAVRARIQADKEAQLA
jgi:GTP-binding protein|tara:strand:- start:18303 stop:19322 length:1020 start_codon:yes stop_codon:yes gene_type:complete